FLLSRPAAPRDLHSFPTRRSSDLFVHRDADARDPTERLTEIDQAFKLIKSPPYVRVVPVQETEAWLLVDESAIREHLGIPSDPPDRKSTRLNSSHVKISYAVFCLK